MKLFFAERESFISQVRKTGFAAAVAGPEVDVLLSGQRPQVGAEFQVIEIDVPGAARYELIEPLDLPDGRWFAIPAAELDAMLPK